MVTNEIRAYLEDKFNLFHRFLTVLSDTRVSSGLMDHYEFYRLICEKFGEKIYCIDNPRYESIQDICLSRPNRRQTSLSMGNRWESLYTISMVKTCDVTVFTIYDTAICECIIITSYEWEQLLRVLEPTD